MKKYRKHKKYVTVGRSDGISKEYFMAKEDYEFPWTTSRVRARIFKRKKWAEQSLPVPTSVDNYRIEEA